MTVQNYTIKDNKQVMPKVTKKQSIKLNHVFAKSKNQSEKEGNTIRV